MQLWQIRFTLGVVSSVFSNLVFINSSELLQNFLFSTDGRGLQGLAAQLHTRCQWVVRHKGQRYPK